MSNVSDKSICIQCCVSPVTSEKSREVPCVYAACAKIQCKNVAFCSSNFVAIFRYQFATKCRCSKTFVSSERNKWKERKKKTFSLSLYQPTFSINFFFLPRIFFFSVFRLLRVCLFNLKHSFFPQTFSFFVTVILVLYDLFMVFDAFFFYFDSFSCRC